MKRLFLPLFFFLSAVSLFSQAPKIVIEVEEGVNPWNHLQVNHSPQSFQFAIVTDRTGGLRPGIFASAVPKLNLLQPEFVMSVGDLIMGYTEDEARIDREWDEFDAMVDQLQMPFFYLPGNHDYINDVMAKKWKERHGKDYYHFTYQDVLFLCLNSEELKRGSGKGYIDTPQYEYVKKTLADNADVKWTFIFMHQPLWDQDDSGRWGDIEKLLEGRKHSVFVGHRHRYVKYERNNSKYFILATTGGGTRLRGPAFGEFDHVVWVTMTDDGPIIANLMLEGIWDENVNTEEYIQFSNPLMNQRPWEITPVYAEAKGFKEGKTNVRISNNSDVPMHAKIDLTSSENLWIQGNGFDKIIDPNSVEIWEADLATKGGKRLKNLSPVSLDFTLTYRPENEPELEIRGKEKIKPISFETIEKSTLAHNIDGNSDEWSELRFNTFTEEFAQATPITHRGKEDCSIAFDLTWDDAFLYLFATVTDDQLETAPELSWSEKDALFVAIDARPKEKSVMSKGEGMMVFGVSPEKGNPIMYSESRYPKGTQIAAKQTPEGYTVEMAIPVDYLNKTYGSDWQEIRLDIFANDNDYQGKHISQIFWKPDWRSDENIMGSGMFRRE